MDLTWDLEAVVRTSDDEAVRRRFDRRNLAVLFALLGIFLFVALVQLGADRKQHTPFDVWIAVVNLGLNAFGLFFLRFSWREEGKSAAARTPVGRWLRQHVSATVITWVTIQYVLLLAFSRRDHDWVTWAILFPAFLLAFRMLVSELVLIHAILATIGFAMALFAPGTVSTSTSVYVGIITVSGAALAIELFASLRWRRAIVTEWRRRREQAVEQVRMREELHYARELQLSMLPECAPRLDWVDICSISVPATEVGGDYYDYFVDGDRIALVCGDVAGHGMASGLVLAGLRSGFTLLRDSLGDPAAVLRRLHDLVGQTTRRRMLVTVSVALLQKETLRATITSAGHPPVLIRRAGGVVETVDLWAPPLGVRLPVEIPQRDVQLRPGDVLILHSDGIYEARNDADESYGFERLEQVIRNHSEGSAEELRNAILQDVELFRGGAPQDDDMTLVIARLL